MKRKEKGGVEWRCTFTVSEGSKSKKADENDK